MAKKVATPEELAEAQALATAIETATGETHNTGFGEVNAENPAEKKAFSQKVAGAFADIKKGAHISLSPEAKGVLIRLGAAVGALVFIGSVTDIAQQIDAPEAQETYSGRAASAYYQAFNVEHGVSEDEKRTGSVNHSVSQQITDWSNAATLADFSDEEKANPANYAARSNLHFITLSELSEDAAEKQKEIVDKINNREGWYAVPFVKKWMAKNAANEANALSQNAQIELYMWQTNEAGVKALQLQAELDELVKKHNLDNNDIRVQEIRRNLNIVLGKNNDGLAFDANVLYKDGISLTNSASYAKESAAAVNNAIGNLKDLRIELGAQNQEDKTVPSVSDWTDDMFVNSNGIGGVLEQKLLGSLAGVDIVGLADDNVVGGMTSYNPETKELVVVLRTADENVFLRDVLGNVEEREYAKGEIATLIQNGQIKVTEISKYEKVSFQDLDFQNHDLYIHVAKAKYSKSDGYTTTILGDVYEGSFGGRHTVYDDEQGHNGVIYRAGDVRKQAVNELKQQYISDQGMTIYFEMPEME